MSGAPTFTPKALKRGVIARQFSDWFADEAIGGRTSIGPLAGNNTRISLFNNDPAGRDFAVYGLEVFSDTALQAAILGFTQGHPVAVAIPCQSADPMGAPAVGQLFADYDAGFGGTILYAFNRVDLGAQWRHDFPIAIVPKGFSLFVEGTAQNTDLAVSFWFIPVPL